MKKAKTWIVTCIYLQLLFICFGSLCRNPVTNAVNDIGELVGNIPKDYIMHMKSISKNNLPKHCWFFVMVREVSQSLGDLSLKFSNTSQNYRIVESLTLIFREIRNCIQHTDSQVFVEDYLDSVEEMELLPITFFETVSETISVFREINKTQFNTQCVLPTADPREVDSFTRGGVQFASSLLRDGVRTEGMEEKEVSSGRLLLPWTSIASIVIGCTVIGFLLGVLCWKIKHQRDQANNEVPEIHRDKKEDNELNNMLQLKAAKEISII